VRSTGLHDTHSRQRAHDVVSSDDVCARARPWLGVQILFWRGGYIYIPSKLPPIFSLAGNTLRKLPPSITTQNHASTCCSCNVLAIIWIQSWDRSCVCVVSHFLGANRKNKLGDYLLCRAIILVIPKESRSFVQSFVQSFVRSIVRINKHCVWLDIFPPFAYWNW
jgi:hypothetical protein